MPLACKRNTSFIFLMDNLLAGIRISSFNEKSQDTLVIPRQLSLSDMPLQGVATFTGMGGRFQTVWVATFHRNRWQPWTGIHNSGWLRDRSSESTNNARSSTGKATASFISSFVFIQSPLCCASPGSPRRTRPDAPALRAPGSSLSLLSLLNRSYLYSTATPTNDKMDIGLFCCKISSVLAIQGIGHNRHGRDPKHQQRTDPEGRRAFSPSNKQV